MKEIQAKQTIVDDSLREIKGHGTEDFPIAVYFDDFFDFENGFISWHWHEEVQITMILEGDFICRVERVSESIPQFTAATQSLRIMILWLQKLKTGWVMERALYK